MFEENRLKLGIFVITGVSLLVAFLFLLGFKDAMKPSFTVYTYFNESVQGLEVGSPVKFKGVTVGAVSNISIYDMGKKIRVQMKTNGAVFASAGPEEFRKPSVELYNKMLKNGLGCEQKFTGITGMKIIEISYHTSDLAEVDSTIQPPDGAFFLPAHKSDLDNSIETVTSIVHKFGKIDFEKISKDLSETISGINKLVNDKKISKIIESVETSTKNIETLIAKVNLKIDDVDVKKISTDLSETLQAYEKLATTLDREIKALDLNKLSKEATVTLAHVTTDIKDLKESLNMTLEKGNSTLIDVQQTLENLQEDPSSLLLGKQKKPIFPVEE